MATATQSLKERLIAQVARSHLPTAVRNKVFDCLPEDVEPTTFTTKDDTITFVYREIPSLTEGTESYPIHDKIVKSLENAALKRHFIKQNTASYSSGRLGELTPGCLDGHHKQKKVLPPCTSFERFCCVHNNLTRKRNKDGNDSENVEKNEIASADAAGNDPRTTPGDVRTHVRKDGTVCELQVEVRKLKAELSASSKVVPYVAVTLDASECSCPEMLQHRRRLTSAEREYLIKEFLKHGSPKEVFEKAIAPLVNGEDVKTFSVARLLKMLEPELKRFATAQGLDTGTRQGAEDFTATRTLLEQMKSEGATVAFKLPGEDPAQCQLLPAEAKKFLKTSDLFVYVSTEVQSKLVDTFGDCVATDGTHAVFSYDNVKVIAVNVSSYCQDPTVTERGFPVALAITTSEREDIHKAIVACLLSNTKKSWKPKLLMSDMAFAAFNAWKEFFPSLVWFWCVFHVWQAWHRKVKQTPRPKDMSQDDFVHLKGHILREMLFLISPPEGHNLTWEEFDSRSSKLLKVMWGTGLTDLAESLELYLLRKEKWAPPARRAAVDLAFGTGMPVPKFAVSNNSLESFFCFLKYKLLGGKSAKTMKAFLDMWKLHDARIKINILKANINLRLLFVDGEVPQIVDQSAEDFEPSSVMDVIYQEIEAFNFGDGSMTALQDEALDEEKEISNDEALEATEQRQFLDEAAGWSAEKPDLLDEELDENLDLKRHDAETNAPSSSSLSGATRLIPLVDGTNIDARDRRSRPALRSAVDTVNTQLCQSISRAENALARLRVWQSEHSEHFRDEKLRLVSQIDKFERLVAAGVSLDTAVDVEALGPGPVRRFVKQVNNYGSSVVPESVVMASENAMFKSKRRRVEKSSTPLEEESFDDFSKPLLDSAGFEDAVRIAKEGATHTNYAALRAQLRKNNVVRKRAIASALFGLATSTRVKKNEVIDKIVAEVARVFRLPVEAESLVGDVGKLRSNQDQVAFQGELICLKLNSTNNVGDPAVTACKNLVGWIRRGDELFQVEVEESRIIWGQLELKQIGSTSLT